MTCRDWTRAEVAIVMDNAHLGAAAIVELLVKEFPDRPARTIHAVMSCAKRQGLSLRRRGERRGRIRGIKPGIHDEIPAQIRQAIRAGHVTIEEIESGEWARCPWCGSNPVALEGRAAELGVCQECFNRRKTEEYIEAQRDTAERAKAVHTSYNREKQRSKRDRDAISQAEAARRAAEADMADEGWV